MLYSHSDIQSNTAICNLPKYSIVFRKNPYHNIRAFDVIHEIPFYAW